MNLSHWIAHRAAHRGAAVALRFEGRDITYAALHAQIGRVAAMLSGDLGLRRGDRIGHLGYNSPDYLALLFAAARIGATVVPLNWRLAPPEHLFQLENAGVSALLVEPELREPIAARLTGCRIVPFGFGAEALPGGDAEAPQDGGPEDPLLIVYTSGTTGRPKGAVLTQAALTWNAINGLAFQQLTAADRVLTVLPMFHVGAMNIQTLPALHAGATVVLHRRFAPAETLAAIAAERITQVLLVPAVMKAMIDHPAWAATDLSSLTMAVTGSQIVPIPLIEAFHARGVPVGQVYGSTETAPIAIVLGREDAHRKLGSTGIPAMHCEARIVDDSGREVPRGMPGEILIRGGNILSAYWRDPVATAAAIRDGWFHTGDIGHQDEEGYYYIDERKKDLIISGGENIYPAEVEAVMAELPEVAEVTVVARPDAQWGEVPVAFVVPRPGAACDGPALLARLQGRLARFKHPRAILFVAELPRNAMGKVLRYRLREMADGSSG